MMAGTLSSTWLLAAGALLCAGVAAPAHAQGGDTRKASHKESTRTMLEFAECTAANRRFRPDMDRFLRTSPASPEFGTLARSFAKDRCVPADSGTVEMRFDFMLFRYSLFEARYRNEFGKGPPPSVEGLPPLDLDSEFDLAIMPGLQGVSTLPPVVVFLRQLSDCVIREKPVESHALIAARPYSKAETTALEAVMPALAACMPEGHTMKFSRPMLRGAIAEALYKAATYSGPRVAAAPKPEAAQ